jgi:hypothetical protein
MSKMSELDICIKELRSAAAAGLAALFMASTESAKETPRPGGWATQTEAHNAGASAGGAGRKVAERSHRRGS